MQHELSDMNLYQPQKHLNIFQYFETKSSYTAQENVGKEQTENQWEKNRFSDFSKITYAKHMQWKNEPPSYVKSNTIFKCLLLTDEKVAVKYWGLCLGVV